MQLTVAFEDTSLDYKKKISKGSEFQAHGKSKIDKERKEDICALKENDTYII